jgi:hypothetical protein
MFCPQCKCEFQLGFARCNDCDLELVDHLVEEEPANPDAPGYVVIATVSGPLEDSQICSFLEANGIPTQIREAPFRRPYSFGMTSVQVLVPAEFTIVARELMGKADRGDLEIEEA